MKRRALIFAHMLLILGLGSCAKNTPTLSLLVWEGYADPSFIKGFEEQCKCKVSASYMGTSDELVSKLRGGSASNYDVISPSSDVATMIASANLAAPLDLSRIPTYGQLTRKLTSLPLVHVNGNVWCALHLGTKFPDLRRQEICPTARQLECAVGPEVSREDFGLG